MDQSKVQEELSICYLQTLCAKDHIVYERYINDNDSTDATLRKTIILDNGIPFQVKIGVQLKTVVSSYNFTEDDTFITYRLKVKNYNDLVGYTSEIKILCLLILPQDIDSWISWSDEELLMKGRMYWADLRGFSKSDNVESISIKIDKKNVISPNGLVDLIDYVQRKYFKNVLQS